MDYESNCDKTYLCSCDDCLDISLPSCFLYQPPKSSSSSSSSSLSKIGSPAKSSCRASHKPNFTCKYNPSRDQTEGSEIHDLKFAQSKFDRMKCQMKQWQMERLQLESENRKLKEELRSFGK